MKINAIYSIRVIFTYLLLGALILPSCQTTDDFPTEEKKLVVDGWIEQGAGAQVILTFTSDYLTNVDSVSALSFMASHAKVSVTNVSVNEVLTLHPSDVYFPPLVYSGYELKGKTGNSYQLEVISNGQKHTAQATIPSPPIIDSVWMEEVNDTSAVIRLRINDPAQEVNYYRVFTQRVGIDKRFIPAYLPNFSDELFNGTIFETPIYLGDETNLHRKKSMYFKWNDEILIKVCSMDKQAYEYWTRVQMQLSGTKNPFASNGKALPTNITGNAIGYWCGYGVTTRRIMPLLYRKK